jgi:hypothetical protein
MAKRVSVPISNARKQLFHLTDLIRKSGDDTVVVLEQRGGVEPVAMVREARLAYLEARVEELDKAGRKSFTLTGSLATDLDDEAIEQSLRELRSDWTPRASKGPVKRPARRRPGRGR